MVRKQKKKNVGIHGKMMSWVFLTIAHKQKCMQMGAAVAVESS